VKPTNYTRNLVGFFSPPPTPPEIYFLFFYIYAIIRIMECEFSNPYYWDTIERILKPLDETVARPDTWNFTKIICDTSEMTNIYELVENPEISENQFYLQKTISYGDFFVIFFLTLFTLIFFFNFIFNFIFKKRITFRK